MTNLLDRATSGGRSSRSSGASRSTRARPAGDAEASGTAHRLPGGPRRRRPLLVAAAGTLVFLSIGAFVSIYSAGNHQTEVLVVTRTIQQGQMITGADLGPALVAVSAGVIPIAVADASTLSGKRAAVTIPAGSLLVPGDVTSASQLPPGDAIVGVALKVGQLPSDGVAAGDQVMIVQTAEPGTPVVAGLQSASAGSVGVATGVLVPEATVFDTSVPSAAASSGVTELVSVEVLRKVAAEVSTAATAGQISLVLLPGSTSGATSGSAGGSSAGSSGTATTPGVTGS